MRPATVLTAAGEVVLRRRYFWGRGRGGCYPSDDKAGIAASAVSAGARELCCVMGLASDFRSAAANLRRVGGLGVSAASGCGRSSSARRRPSRPRATPA